MARQNAASVRAMAKEIQRRAREGSKAAGAGVPEDFASAARREFGRSVRAGRIGAVGTFLPRPDSEVLGSLAMSGGEGLRNLRSVADAAWMETVNGCGMARRSGRIGGVRREWEGTR